MKRREKIRERQGNNITTTRPIVCPRSISVTEAKCAARRVVGCRRGLLADEVVVVLVLLLRGQREGKRNEMGVCVGERAPL